MSSSNPNSGLDFSMVIASTVHDMKNSLAQLTQMYARWLSEQPEQLRFSREQVSIEYEFARLNGMLVQMLGLYKLGVNQLPLRPEYHELEDFLEAQLARQFELLTSRQISTAVQLEDPSLLGFFDLELVGSALTNVIINSTRYAHSRLEVSAEQCGEFIVLKVCDDGEGYPQAMIEAQADYVLGINHSTGSTGLGLYFAAQIAHLHERNGLRGFIKICNGGRLGGSEFALYLP